MITVTTHIEEKPYLRLMLLLGYRKPMSVIVHIACLVILAGFVFKPGGYRYNDSQYIGLLLCAWIFIGAPVYAWFANRRNYRSNGRIQETIVYSFTDEGVQAKGASFSTEMTWDKVYKILELKNWVLIYHNRQAATVIPKKDLGDQLPAFKELVKGKSVKLKLR